MSTQASGGQDDIGANASLASPNTSDPDFKSTEKVATSEFPVSSQHNSIQIVDSCHDIRVKAQAIKTKNLIVEYYPTTDLKRGLVGWESQDDPLHPRNWTMSRKWIVVTVINGLAAISFGLCITIEAPGLSLMNKDFNNKSETLSTLVVSIYVLGLAFGPLVAGPFSEIYGRRPVLIVGNAVLTACQLCCALSPDLGFLIAFRFLGGVGGCAAMSLFGGVMADMFPVQERGTVNAFITLGQGLGAGCAPLLGGVISQQLGWRWAYWILLMVCGIFTIMHLLWGLETNAPVLIRRKIARLQKVTGATELMSAYDEGTTFRALKTTAILTTGIARPLRIVYSSPVLQITALHQCIIFGTYVLFISTLSDVFMHTYGWDSQASGLAYLGIPIGFTIGALIVGYTSDALVIYLTRRNHAIFEPEFRLPPAMLYGFLPPIALFWYGWSAQKHNHWIQPAIAIMIFALGDMGVFTGVQGYFVDATGEYAASASSTFLTARCLFGAFLPLVAPTLYESIGLGWGNSVLGFITLAMVPIPYLIYRYGARLRARYPMRVVGRRFSVRRVEKIV